MSDTFTEKLQRDDGTLVYVTFTQSQYYPATGPSRDDPGSPAEGGEIDLVSCTDAQGVEVAITETERSRFEDELYRMPPHEYERDPDEAYEQSLEDARCPVAAGDDPF